FVLKGGIVYCRTPNGRPNQIVPASSILSVSWNTDRVDGRMMARVECGHKSFEVWADELSPLLCILHQNHPPLDSTSRHLLGWGRTLWADLRAGWRRLFGKRLRHG